MIKTRLVGLLSHAKKYIVYAILWQWVALLSQVLAVFSIADLLERVIYQSVTAAVVERTIITLILVVIVRFSCERMGARSSYLACVDVKRILREKIYEKMLKLGASYKEQVSSSEVVQVSTEGVEQLEILQFNCTTDIVCDSLPGEHESQCSSSDLCAIDSNFYRSGTENRKEIAEQILEYLYRTWRFLSGKSAGIDNSENLSG